MSIRKTLKTLFRKILILFTTGIVIFTIVQNASSFMTFLEEKENLDNKSKVILLYTNFFKGPWYLRWKDHSHCKYHCDFTYRKSKLRIADAVAFHDADMPGEMPNRTTSKQIWIYFNLESPLNSHAPDYRNVFNWTMSYRADADIFTPYGDFTPLDCDEKQQTQRLYSRRNFSLGKTRMIAWMSSNCRDTFGRFSYVKLLSKYVQVHIFGKCGKFACPTSPYSLQSSECKQQLKKYKFYLAFENSFCEDYITEKYWQVALQHEMVPIVMGGGDYRTLAIPGSFINVDDFETIKKLSDYLIYLDSNHEAYNAYFKWKTSYSLDTPYLYGCAMCTALQSSKVNRPKIISSLHAYWKEGKCKERKHVRE